MTDEEKRKLLLQDLCPRLPYEVKIEREWVAPMTGSPEQTTTEFSTFDVEVLSSWLDEEGGGLVVCDDGKHHWVRKYSCKPYLRPLSSMTEKEKISVYEIYNRWFLKGGSFDMYVEVIDWLNQHHFDYRNLISLGLALEAPKDMY